MIMGSRPGQRPLLNESTGVVVGLSSPTVGLIGPPGNCTDPDHQLSSIDQVQVAILTSAFICCCVSFVNNAITLLVTHRIRQFPFIKILAIADLIFSTTYLIGAPYRIYLLFHGEYRTVVPIWQCFNTPWVWTYDIGNFWPATITLFMRVERLVAESWPLWYNKNCLQFQCRLKWGLKAVLAAFLMPSLTAAIIGSVNKLVVEKQMTWSQCTGYFGHNYHMFSNLYAVVCSVFTILAGWAISKFRHLEEREGADMCVIETDFSRQQKTLSKASRIIVLTNVVFVILPNIFRALERVKVLDIGEHRRGLTTMTITNGAINLAIYLRYIPAFKKAVIGYVFKNTAPPTQVVTPAPLDPGDACSTQEMHQVMSVETLFTRVG